MNTKRFTILLLSIILSFGISNAQDFVGFMQQGKIYFNKQNYINALERFDMALALAKSDIEKKDAETWKNNSFKNLQMQFNQMELSLRANEIEIKKTNYIIETLYFYDNRIALAIKDEKYGYIDKNGQTIIPFNYDEASPFDAFSGFAKVSKGNLQFLIDSSGIEYPLAINTGTINGGTVAVDFRNQQLSTLPPQLFNCASLKVLLLGNNSLTNISSQISRLKNLLFLDLSNNKIQYLPEEIGQLENLGFLSLTGNQLSKLPEKIVELNGLIELRVNNNNLFSLPTGFGNLYKLNYLNLDNNKLRSLSPEIGKLNNLKILSAQNNLINSLAPEIGNLTKLEQLIINGNEIVDIPMTFDRLMGLKKLELAKNKIGNIPVELKKLVDLKDLDLRGNRIPDDKKELIKSWFPNCKVKL